MAGCVRGAAHIRLGLPNQDALAYSPRRKPGPPLILALADGHGSPASFRSAYGAQTAVSNAITALRKLAPALESEKKGASSTDWCAPLCEHIVCNWRERIRDHLAAHPFKDEEWQVLKEKGLERHIHSVEENPWLAYGTTLLAVLMTAESTYLLQLGDGDLLVVQNNGDVGRLFPHDERFIANQTTSLCMPQAWMEMRTAVLAHADTDAALIMASTDGYVNSFRDEAAFFQAGRDFLAYQRRYGARFIRRRLSGWLTQTSRHGSGDDISLGMLYRQNGDES